MLCYIVPNEKTAVLLGAFVALAVAAARSWLVATCFGSNETVTVSPLCWTKFWAIFKDLALLVTLAVLGYCTYETFIIRRHVKHHTDIEAPPFW